MMDKQKQSKASLANRHSRLTSAKKQLCSRAFYSTHEYSYMRRYDQSADDTHRKVAILIHVHTALKNATLPHGPLH